MHKIPHSKTQCNNKLPTIQKTACTMVHSAWLAGLRNTIPPAQANQTSRQSLYHSFFLIDFHGVLVINSVSFTSTSSMHTHIHPCVHCIYIHTCTHIHACIHVSMHSCIHPSIHEYIYMNVCIHTYIHTYIHIYIHIYIHQNKCMHVQTFLYHDK